MPISHLYKFSSQGIRDDLLHRLHAWKYPGVTYRKPATERPSVTRPRIEKSASHPQFWSGTSWVNPVGGHTRQMRDAVFDCVGILGTGPRRDVQGQHVLRHDSDGRMAEAKDLTHHQRGGQSQHERQRDFGDDESVADTRMAASSRHARPPLRV